LFLVLFLAFFFQIGSCAFAPIGFKLGVSYLCLLSGWDYSCAPSQGVYVCIYMSLGWDLFQYGCCVYKR
jgi:hypothetical protein